MIAPAALDESGKPADFSTMEEQMRVTYANAAKLLARFGATLDHVVEETLYVLDVDTAFAVAGKVRKEAYATARPQCASNLIGVARLAGLISARECQMLAYNESAHAFFKWDPAKGEYPNLVLFAIWEQRSEDQSASDEYGRFIVTLGA
jgi:enamine deaminase RidA (YjgF/YER057c/UK114 family)